MTRRVPALLLFCSLAPTLASAQVSGVWETSQGQMTLRQAGVKVEGTYAQDNGLITGTMRGTVMEGFWVEDSASQRCSKAAADGRFYWGRIRFVFQADGRFHGAWSYCEASVGADGEWNGTRIGNATPPATPPPSASPTTPVQGGGYYTFYRREVVQDPLGPKCRMNASDANDRGMRLDYTCTDTNDKPVPVAANFDYTLRYPSVMRPGTKVTGRGTLVARADGASASCSIGPAYLVPSLSTNLPEKPSDSSSGEVLINEPWCEKDPCELIVTCNISSYYGLTVNWIYRWVR